MSTVHDVIAVHKDEILSLWLHGMGDAAFAEGLSRAELAGAMPEYLASLGDGVTGDPAQLADSQHELIERHLSSRLRQGATLNEILAEFASLSRCVAAALDREPESSHPTTRDSARMFTELHRACVAAMRIFNEHLLEDEQTMKRYLRLLQRIVDDGGEVRHDRRPLRALLEEALTLIKKAMGAGAAALQLFDVRTGKLVLSAAAGEAGGVIEGYVSRLDLAASPARSHRSEETAEVECSEPEVSDGLRARGIHSLLAVRLAPRHALHGILYLGLRQERHFQSSEIRLAESLGEALVFHLDHAKLCTSLRERAEEATAECALRERFVSILMHDLAGPLAAAQASARALLAIPAARPGAAAIGADLDRAEQMVAGLVDAHRIRAGHRLPIQIADCDLSVLAQEVLEELQESHGDRFILVAEATVRGMWSADQLRRAIWNLASNAIKFGARDSAVIISVKRLESVAELAVTNHGRPLSADEQAALFSPFLAARSGRGHPPGWGLGLTLVWGCVEAHGGRVEVESEAKAGTTIRVFLPFDARPYED
jgi:signal transduction histidine kinase